MDDRLPPRLQALICPIPWTGCWLFTGRWESRNGYGRLEYQGKPTVFHRVIYELLVGPIPDGHLVDHRCAADPRSKGRIERGLRAHGELDALARRPGLPDHHDVAGRGQRAVQRQAGRVGR